MTNVSLEEIAKIYWNEVWKLHRISQTVLSDKGLQFILRFIEDLMKTLETKRILSTVYHCQTDE